MKNVCEVHINDEAGDTPDRLGVMTRGRRAEMGLDINFLTTAEGCRKRDAINVRSDRSKTAGMLFAYRPCGISLGHSGKLSKLITNDNDTNTGTMIL